MGRVPCQLKLENVRLVDVFSGEIIEEADIFIDQGKIIDAGRACRANAFETVNLHGALVAPGLSMLMFTSSLACSRLFNLQG